VLKKTNRPISKHLAHGGGFSKNNGFAAASGRQSNGAAAGAILDLRSISRQLGPPSIPNPLTRGVGDVRLGSAHMQVESTGRWGCLVLVTPVERFMNFSFVHLIC